MFEDLRRRRAAKRVKGGDGHPLRPFRWWQLLSGRKLLYLDLSGEDGHHTEYAVDVRLWGKEGGELEGKAHLFLDGRHHAESELPARFPVEGGTIDVTVSMYGLRRAHYVTAEGAERQLTPDSRSAIGRRLRFHREHPVSSRWIGGAAVVMLVVGIGLNLLQVAEPILGIPPLVERFGTYESPIRLPLWLNITLGFGAGLASMERGLRMQYHWLLDAVGN